MAQGAKTLLQGYCIPAAETTGRLSAPTPWCVVENSLGPRFKGRTRSSSAIMSLVDGMLTDDDDAAKASVKTIAMAITIPVKTSMKSS
jgi:hypothetical protein